MQNSSCKKIFIRNFIPTSTLARGVFKSCKEEWKSGCGMLNVHSVVLCFIVKLCSFLHSTGESGQSFFASGLRRRMFFIKMTHQLLAAGLFRSWHICQQNKFLFCEINTLSLRSGKYFETTGKNKAEFNSGLNFLFTFRDQLIVHLFAHNYWLRAIQRGTNKDEKKNFDDLSLTP